MATSALKPQDLLARIHFCERGMAKGQRELSPTDALKWGCLFTGRGLTAEKGERVGAGSHSSSS